MKTTRHNNDWKQTLNEIAKTAANVLMDAAFSTHRGKAYAGDGIYVIFGNDGYTCSERTRAEAAAAIKYADEVGYAHGDIQTSEIDDGYTWAVAVMCSAEEADEIGGNMSEAWYAQAEKK